MRATAVICTWNPDLGRLAGVARALRAQTLSRERWDWLVIDNGSTPPVPAELFPPEVRIVREERGGVAMARLRAIRESQTELLVFFDDDNEAAPDYLEQAVALFERRPDAGVAGGRIDGVFERPPGRALAPYLGWLAVRPWVVSEMETERVYPWRNLPPGAGMAIRREAALRYAEAAEGDPARLAMDRTKGKLTGSGDTDLALCALDLGYASILSPALRLRHIIPAWRLETEYLERLLEGSTFSTGCLARLRGVKARPGWINRLARRLKRVALAHPADWAVRLRLERALDRGERLALRGDCG